MNVKEVFSSEMEYGSKNRILMMFYENSGVDELYFMIFTEDYLKLSKRTV